MRLDPTVLRMLRRQELDTVKKEREDEMGNPQSYRTLVGAMMKKLGTHRSKTQCASTEINLWSRSLFYINFQVLWARRVPRRVPASFMP